MKKSASRRRHAQLTREQLAQLQKDRNLIADELPALTAKRERLRRAAEESSPSGELRRAIHTSDILLHDLAGRADTNMKTLDAFLVGEQTLTSDVIDRLAAILKLTLVRYNGSLTHQDATEWPGAFRAAKNRGDKKLKK